MRAGALFDPSPSPLPFTDALIWTRIISVGFFSSNSMFLKPVGDQRCLNLSQNISSSLFRLNIKPTKRPLAPKIQELGETSDPSQCQRIRLRSRVLLFCVVVFLVL